MKVKTNSPTTNPVNAQGIRVFVYGTLKRLHYNHALIEEKHILDTEFLGFCYIEGPYQMRDLTFFPGVQFTLDPKEKNRIYGEVYRIGPDTLKTLDILEGNGHFFTRTQVETPWKKAWMYMIPQTYSNDKALIVGGMWKPTVAETSFMGLNRTHRDAAEYFASING